MLAHVSKFKGPQSIIKVKERIGPSGFCSVQHYSKTGKKEFLLFLPVHIYIMDEYPKIHSIWLESHNILRTLNYL